MNENAVPSAPEGLVRVFVSYAREDRRWLDPDSRYSLIPFLKDSLRRHQVAFWFDKQLQPGDEFRRLIESEIDQSQIALLIVSQNFLNSEFIENREMPRIAERARLGKMIVVPVLVEPCDWSEYPFLADRQMVPSSPLIDYTESEPQWAKVRFQILDGLKAQLKRIREAPQSHAQKAQTNVPEEVQSVSATSEAARALETPPTIPEAGNALEDHADPLTQEQETWEPELVFPPRTELEVSRSSSREPHAATTESVPVHVDISKPAKAPTLETAFPPSAPARAISEDRTKISTAGREKARIPRKWKIAIAGGAVALVAMAVFISRGTPWTARKSGTTQGLTSIFGAIDGQRLWAVGWYGTILESDDRGETWTARHSGTTNALLSVFGTSDGQHLWAVGQLGTIAESDDGGANWTGRKSGTKSDLYSIFGTSDGKRLWAVGYDNNANLGAILESGDGGTTWTARNSGTGYGLSSIFGTSDGEHLWTGGWFGTTLESKDGGATWAARNSGAPSNLNSIRGTSDGKHFWAVGNHGTIVESVDEGATWAVRKSGTTNDLYSIFGTSDGKHLWAVGDEGMILESDDGGASWAARNSFTLKRLFSIFGTSDGQHLWAVGDKGTILESGRW